MTRVCGCCEPPAALAPLEVENRPSLPSIAYRIGTFAGFREALLLDIARTPGIGGLTTRRDDDFSVALIGLWAAVADVLTFYQERYANEAFLRTAVQRESIARLARLIGYRLAPGVAAEAELVVDVDERAVPAVQLPLGVRVQSLSGPAETAQTFETLEPLAAEAALDALRVLPAPQPVNPLASGTREATLAPGPRGLESAASLAAGDRVAVFRTGSEPALEELTVAAVRTEDDRLVVVWENPVVGENWPQPLDGDETDAVRVAKIGRSFGLFGADAPPTYVAGTVPDSKYPSQVSWLLKSRTNWTYDLTPSGGSTTLLLGSKDQVAKGTRLLLWDATSGTSVLVSVVDADQAQATLEPMSATVTRLTLGEDLSGVAVDRRTARLLELLGPDVAFWAYAYPPTLTAAEAYLPGRRSDATTIEVGQTIGAGEIQPGVTLNVQRLELGRRVLLEDAVGGRTFARLGSASLARAGVGFASTTIDATTAAELGLASEDAVAGLASAPVSFPDSLPAVPQLAVTIGGVGPRTIAITGGPSDVVSLAAELERSLRAADPARGFTEARVIAADDRVLVVPGEVGALIRFDATEADPASALVFGLDPRRARAALLTGVAGTTASAREVAVTFGALGRRVLAAGGIAAGGAPELQRLIRQADRGRAFAAAVVRALSDGRLLIVSGIVQADEQDYVRLGLWPEHPGTALDSRTAVLRGNVVRAGHGETVGDEVVGDGDASTAFQRLALKKAPLTYLPSPVPGGIESSLELFVGGVRWQETASLYGQPPTAQVFVAEQAADGTTVLQFGDGREGARLPSGRGNVTATYRVGLGLQGRVRAGALASPLDRPQGLGAVANPLPADGGADPEAADDARRNAPRTVRTFGRAVSLEDFEDVAMETGEVAKAQAIWVWDGFARGVHVTVARSGGGTILDAGLRRLLVRLDAVRDPNHPLRIASAVPVPVSVRATLQIDAAYVRDSVLARARDALLAALSFDALALGEPLALSDVVVVLQDVPGVVAVDVDLLAFKQPARTGDAEFDRWLTRRGVERAPDGTVLAVQRRLRIMPARPDPEHRGAVFPGELTTVESPTQDIVLTATGGLAR